MYFDCAVLPGLHKHKSAWNPRINQAFYEGEDILPVSGHRSFGLRNPLGESNSFECTTTQLHPGNMLTEAPLPRGPHRPTLTVSCPDRFKQTVSSQLAGCE